MVAYVKTTVFFSFYNLSIILEPGSRKVLLGRAASSDYGSPSGSFYAFSSEAGTSKWSPPLVAKNGLQDRRCCSTPCKIQSVWADYPLNPSIAGYEALFDAIWKTAGEMAKLFPDDGRNFSQRQHTHPERATAQSERAGAAWGKGGGLIFNRESRRLG
jgi:hypothetical protein